MKTIYGYLIGFFAATLLLAGCVKDSFDGEPMGDAGTTFVSFSEAPERIIYLSPFTDVRNVGIFTITKFANSNASLNNPLQVSIKAAPEVIDDYNEEHEADYEFLPEDIFTVVNPAFSATADGFNIEFKSGDFAQEYTIALDGSKFDLTKKYAVAYILTNSGGLPANAGKDTIFAIVSVKNDYDGIYKYTTSANTSVIPNQETEVELQTTGPNSVQVYPGLLGAYSNEVFYTIDPETFAVTVSCPSLGVQEPQDARSVWNPDTKTLKVYWNNASGAYTFEETYEYIGPRP
ncbi:DUF1735 domain-containing protein [Parapedobacter sp. 2B3]|uniref:DUF1735 domain-containing protein n=1 Tax=Parapedobacter sp. 2B3 TaxID=3342381 RepID=UPI0035B5AC35